MDAAHDILSRVAGQVERLFAEPGSSMTIEIAQTRLRFERRTFGAISFSHVNIADIDRIFVTDGGDNDR
jgi:hypothetical protein